MPFWSKWFRGEETHPAATPIQFPLDVEVVPGELTVHVFSHGIDDVDGSFWSFVSDGLRSRGQREIVVTLRRRPAESESDFPRPLLSYFSQVHSFALRGRFVVPGQWTEFGPPGFLEQQLRALVYVDAAPIREVPIPAGALTALFLNAAELDVAKQCGVFRVLGRLGHAYGYFPYPSWSDRDRATVATETTESVSILNRIPCMRVADLSLVLEAQHLRMTVHPKVKQALAGALDKLPPNVGFALVTTPSPEVDGWLVWQPGQKQPTAITMRGSSGLRLNGCFLAIAPGLDRDEVRMTEDGFSLLIRGSTWNSLKVALSCGNTFSIASDDTAGMSFELCWIQLEYENPVDGNVYHAEGGWRDYRPQGLTEDSRERVILLVSQEELAMAVDITAFSGYLKELRDCVRAEFPSTGLSGQAIFQFEISPGELPVLRTHCEPNSELPAALVEHLASISPPEISGRVAFQIVSDPRHVA